MTDYSARQRIISELASDAGLAADKVATEVLFYLPPDFLSAYEELFWQSFKPQGSAPIAGSRQLTEVTEYGQGPFASGGGKKYKEYWVIVSDKAYRRKLRLDAKLKALAENVQEANARANRGSDGDGSKDGSPPVCGGCSKFLVRTWKYCPSCGTGVQSATDNTPETEVPDT